MSILPVSRSLAPSMTRSISCPGNTSFHSIAQSQRLDSSLSSAGRAKLACLFCRKRKVRCDGEGPSCGTCRRHEVECRYAAVPTEVNRATKERKEWLLERKSQGFTIPRGGAAQKACREGKAALLPRRTGGSRSKIHANQDLRPFPSVLIQPGPAFVPTYQGDSFPSQVFSPPHPAPFFDDPTSGWTSSWRTESDVIPSGPAQDPISSLLPTSQPMSTSSSSSSTYSNISESSLDFYATSSSPYFPDYPSAILPITPAAASSFLSGSIHSLASPFNALSSVHSQGAVQDPPESYSKSTPSRYSTLATSFAAMPLHMHRQVWGDPSPSYIPDLYTPSAFVYATPNQHSAIEPSSSLAHPPFSPFTPQAVLHPASHINNYLMIQPQVTAIGLGFTFGKDVKMPDSCFPSNQLYDGAIDEETTLLEGWGPEEDVAFGW